MHCLRPQPGSTPRQLLPALWWSLMFRHTSWVLLDPSGSFCWELALPRTEPGRCFPERIGYSTNLCVQVGRDGRGLAPPALKKLLGTSWRFPRTLAPLSDILALPPCWLDGCGVGVVGRVPS